MDISRVRLILLDRDGVINAKIDGGYVNSLSDFRVNPEIFAFLKCFSDLEIRVAIVTNQQGLGLGITSFTNFFEIQGYFFDECLKRGLPAPHLFYCPHLDGECECRKPKSAMISAALETFRLDANQALLIGDSVTDISAANLENILSIHLINGEDEVCNCTANVHLSKIDEITNFFNLDN